MEVGDGAACNFSARGMGAFAGGRSRGYGRSKVRPRVSTRQAHRSERSTGGLDLPPFAKHPTMNIPFVKAHGAHNDFLLTWRSHLSAKAGAAEDLSRAICNRYTGVGADGWIILTEDSGADAAIELWNSDGSRSEISGNGTRCAAALLVQENRASHPEIRIATGAGPKTLRLLDRRDKLFSFEMNMGRAKVEELNSTLVP